MDEPSTDEMAEDITPQPPPTPIRDDGPEFPPRPVHHIVPDADEDIHLAEPLSEEPEPEPPPVVQNTTSRFGRVRRAKIDKDYIYT